MKKPTDSKEPGAMFCSQYVSHCFRMGGLPLCDHEDINTLPADIEGSKYVQYVATIHVLPEEHNTSLVAPSQSQNAAVAGSS
jgi:hypothetical protein